jgi:hypothetical protein
MIIRNYISRVKKTLGIDLVVCPPVVKRYNKIFPKKRLERACMLLSIGIETVHIYIQPEEDIDIIANRTYQISL